MNEIRPSAWLYTFKEDGDERLTRFPRTDLTDAWTTAPLYAIDAPALLALCEELEKVAHADHPKYEDYPDGVQHGLRVAAAKLRAILKAHKEGTK